MVDNRGGGAGVIGRVAVARAEPDGHTLVLGTNQTHATNQSLLKNCPYDAVKDFAPVAGIADIPHVLVVRRGLEADSVAALVAAREEDRPAHSTTARPASARPRISPPSCSRPRPASTSSTCRSAARRR